MKETQKLGLTVITEHAHRKDIISPKTERDISFGGITGRRKDLVSLESVLQIAQFTDNRTREDFRLTLQRVIEVMNANAEIQDELREASERMEAWMRVEFERRRPWYWRVRAFWRKMRYGHE